MGGLGLGLMGSHGRQGCVGDIYKRSRSYVMGGLGLGLMEAWEGRVMWVI